MTKPDILNPKTWQKGTIPLTGGKGLFEAEVLFVPGSRDKIAKLVEKVGEKHDGWFAYFNRNENMWVVVSHGILALYRTFTYMLDGWDKEVPTVEQVQAVASELNIDFAVLSRNTPVEEVERLRAAVIKGHVDLGNVRNEDKVIARNHLAAMVSLKDSRGRPFNTGVLQCRSIETYSHLGDRLGGIDSMAPWIHFRRELVRRIAKELQKVIAHGIDLLEKLMTATSQSATNTIISRFESEVLNRLTLKPYARASHRLGVDYALLRAAGTTERRNLVASRMHESLRFLTIRLPTEMDLLRLERLDKFIKTEGAELTADQWNEVREIRERLQNMLKWLRGKDPSKPVINTSGWDKPNVIGEVIAHVQKASTILHVKRLPDFGGAKVALDKVLQFV